MSGALLVTTTNFLTVMPLRAPVQQAMFDLSAALRTALEDAGLRLEDGDILAASSKYVAISQGRVVELASVNVSPQAEALAARYNILPTLAQLVLQEADHIFGGIQLGFLLTHTHGILSPNAGLDRSNIPQGRVVLLPAQPYAAAADLRGIARRDCGADVGVILTDSWLMPGRYGTTGVAVGTAGFRPIQDERGKLDLFGNPMQVTQRGIADTLCACAQMVMGERDESTPFAIIRGSGVALEDVTVSVADVAIPWELDIYIEALTTGRWP
jgi:coenzyme F420-0:L-glutamate ligase